MAAQPEGTPCWADAMFPDVEAAKSFYGDVLGWTFGEAATEFGNYTQAYADGRAVAAVVPPMPGQEGPAAWCLYLASDDATATAEKIRANGGETLMDPMRVDGFGTMLLARDPGGVLFGVWQAGSHEGFEAQRVPGAYCWSEVFTRDPGKSDAFFPAVFPYGVVKLEDEHVDFRMYKLGDSTVM
ncbi:VOC family protein, partial [Streptomyces sp. NPDC006435]|uniref:VOC family protein n=1 Tax=Streptomyces sp. NPDC006435 TaxID=3154300 RepID=UPI0033A8248B